MTPERLEQIRRLLEREFAQADEMLESSAEKAGVMLTTLRSGKTMEQADTQESIGSAESNATQNGAMQLSEVTAETGAAVADSEPAQKSVTNV